MNRTDNLGRSSRLLLAGAAMLLGACAGQQRPAAATPPASGSSPVESRAPAAAGSSPGTSNVAIALDILRACHITDADAYFAFDASRITATDRTPLDEVAQCVSRGPLSGRRLKLVGRADPRGTQDYNMTLGQARADAVAAYLGARGVGSAQTQTTSRGAMDATGAGEAGWAKDRRVDVLLAD